MQQKYHSEGLVVLAVNAWDEPKPEVQKFMQDHKLSHRVLLDGKDVFRGTYHLQSVPTNFWIDRRGTIVHQAEGFEEGHQSDMEEWTRRIVQ